MFGSLWKSWVGFSTQPAFPVLLYALLGIHKLLMALIRIVRYAWIKREIVTILLAASNIFQFFALLGSSLLTAPHPRYDFSNYLPHVRLSWGLVLIAFALATYIEGWLTARSIQDCRDNLLILKGEIPMDTKAFYKSKTVWVNAIAVALSVIAVTDPTLFNVDPKIILWVTSVLNIALRTLGGAPLSAKGTTNEG